MKAPVTTNDVELTMRLRKLVGEALFDIKDDQVNLASECARDNLSRLIVNKISDHLRKH